MTDRELLELAAKAYGVILNQQPDEDFLRADHSPRGISWNPKWNPLTDDGDALRLAVALRLNVEHYNDSSQPEPWLRVVDRVGRWTHAGPSVEFSADPLAATRRAIIRAAAATGEAMPSTKQQAPIDWLPEDNYYKSQAEAMYPQPPDAA